MESSLESFRSSPGTTESKGVNSKNDLLNDIASKYSGEKKSVRQVKDEISSDEDIFVMENFSDNSNSEEDEIIEILKDSDVAV